MIGVMYRGRMVEWGMKNEILQEPAHAYTKSLICAVPDKGSDFSDYERYQGEIGADGTREQVSETHWVLRI